MKGYCLMELMEMKTINLQRAELKDLLKSCKNYAAGQNFIAAT